MCNKRRCVGKGRRVGIRWNLLVMSYIVLLASCLVISYGCATLLAEGRVMATEPVSKVIHADPNTIYYAVRWAMDVCGLPQGSEDLAGGVVESKWIPVGAGSHYVDLFKRRDFGANAAYYKMVVKIIPIDHKRSRVEAYTEVKSIVNNVRSTGDKERMILDKIALHARGHEISVTNLGVYEE